MQAPEELRTSRAEILVADANGGGSAMLAGSGGGGTAGSSANALVRSTAAAQARRPAHVLRLGASQQELLEAAQPLQSTKVLQLR